MNAILIDTAKGLVFLMAVGLFLWLCAQMLMFLYAAMGDNIGFLALIPTGLVLAYLYGHALSAQKKYHY